MRSSLPVFAALAIAFLAGITLKLKNSSPNDKLHVVFMGNENCGKTTLLNTLIRFSVPKPSVFKGFKAIECKQNYLGRKNNSNFKAESNIHKTKKMEFFESMNIVFIDTPGLWCEHINLHEMIIPATEIENALKFGKGDFKLVFVLQIQNETIVPQDLATMFTILKGIHKKNMKNKYGIIFNEVSIMDFHTLQKNRTKTIEQVQKFIFESDYEQEMRKYSTNHFFWIPYFEIQNIEWGLPSYFAVPLKKFVFDQLPNLKLKPKKVSLDLDIGEFSDIIELFIDKNLHLA